MPKRKLTSTQELQRKTQKGAYRQGIPWDDHEVAIMVSEMSKDSTTFDIAMRLGRTLYGTSAARSHVRFAINHYQTIRQAGGFK